MGLLEAIVASVEAALQGNTPAAHEFLESVGLRAVGFFDPESRTLGSWWVELVEGRGLSFPTNPNERLFDRTRLPGKRYIRENRIRRHAELAHAPTLDVPVPPLPATSRHRWRRQLQIATGLTGVRLLRDAQRSATEHARSLKGTIERAGELANRAAAADHTPAAVPLIRHALDSLEAANALGIRAFAELDSAREAESTIIRELVDLVQTAFRVPTDRRSAMIEAINASVDRCGLLDHPAQVWAAIKIAYQRSAQGRNVSSHQRLRALHIEQHEEDPAAHQDQDGVFRQQSQGAGLTPSRATDYRLRRRRNAHRSLENQLKNGKHKQPALIAYEQRLRQQGPTTSEEWVKAQQQRARHDLQVKAYAVAIRRMRVTLSEQSARRTARRWLSDPLRFARQLEQAKSAAAEILASTP